MKKTEKQCGIYQIKNKLNNKSYIGSSINIRSRIIAHFSALNRKMHPSKLFAEDYDQYGKHLFDIIILEECKISELFTKEKEYILKYKPEYNSLLYTQRKIVYQYSFKGDFIKEWLSVTEAAKNNNTTVQHIANAAKGVNNHYAKGSLWSYKKYDKFPIKERKTKYIVLYDEKANIIGKWSSFAACARELDIDPSTVKTHVDKKIQKRKYNLYYLD